MLNRTCKSSLLVISTLALFFCVATKAPAQGYELRCRGGEDAFTINKLDTNTLSLNFSASPRAAGADSKGLDPGTCSWIDRVVNDDEPRQIQFAATGLQLKSIPASLSNPANFWSFFVFNTNKGHFEAKSHKPWDHDPTSSSSSSKGSKSFRNRAGIEMVMIPPGSFTMGGIAQADPKFAHKVTIKNGFYMGWYEVTQAQWQAVMGKENPSKFKCDNCPVETVSWHDAQEFMGRLSRMDEGYVYRLPSEAEWEYACRAGTTGDYAGDLDSMAWYSKNSGNQTHPVGQKQANAFGLFDMHGNVLEWCQDWYHENYDGAPTDGSPWLTGGEQKEVVLRGGSWLNFANSLSSAYRNNQLPPDYRSGYIGFRVVAVTRVAE